MKTERVDWIDIAKGITIILVIIGHTINGALRGAIFSFHMPLFFILSCVTFQFSNNNDIFIKKTEKAFKHLFLSALEIYLLRTLLNIYIDFPNLSNYSLTEWKYFFSDKINTFVFGSGVDVIINNSTIRALGIPWFLLVLFWGRTLFDYLHLKIKKCSIFYILIALISLTGILFGQIQWLPFSLDIAFAIQPLFLFGMWLKKYNIKKKTLICFILSFFSWVILLLIMYLWKKAHLEFASRDYPLFPICYICAIAGTMAISAFSQLLSKTNHFKTPLAYLGKNSMAMLWIHCFDKYYSSIYNVSKNLYLNMILRVAVDIFVFIFIMTALYVCKNYIYKNYDKTALFLKY